MTAILDQNENPLAFAAAAKRLPRTRGDRPTHPATLLRWAKRGALLPDGSYLRLKAYRTPGGWVTTETWLSEFIDALTAAALPEGAAGTVAPRSPAARKRASDQAAKKLDDLGI
jgi:hypothetical protein